MKSTTLSQFKKSLLIALAFIVLISVFAFTTQKARASIFDDITPRLPHIDDDFTHLPQDPVVHTYDCDVDAGKITLRGYVNPKGVTDTHAWFQWGTTVALGRETSKSYIPMTVTVEKDLKVSDGDIEEGKTYYFRLVAKNVFFRENGSIKSCYFPFTPIVRTDDATNISDTGATLNGFINPKGITNGTGFFEWGTTTGKLTNKTPEVAITTVTSPTFTLPQLSLCTTYHYRMVYKWPTNKSKAGDIQSFKTTGCPPTPGVLTVSCSAIPNPANKGQNVTWNAAVSGGTGAYTFSWSGTDGLAGSATSTSKIYTTTGAKSATVHVQSGADSVTKTCSALTINEVVVTTLDGTCSASASGVRVGDVLTWTANPSGGNGTYTYAWSGSDSLNGSSQSVNHAYYSPGSVNASVIITSGAQSVTRSCAATIVPPGGGGGGGGGINQPNVGLLGNTKIPAQGLASAYVYLSQVPATGDDDYFANIYYFVGVMVLASIFAMGVRVLRSR